jgi:hypothetical protein
LFVRKKLKFGVDSVCTKPTLSVTSEVEEKLQQEKYRGNGTPATAAAFRTG